VNRPNDQELDAKLEEAGIAMCSCDECRQLDIDSQLAAAVLYEAQKMRTQNYALDKIYDLIELTEDMADKDPDVADAQ